MMVADRQQQDAVALLVRFAVTSLVAAAAWIALTAYEFIALDWYPVREEPASFSLYHLGRWAVSVGLASALVRCAWRGAAPEAPLFTSSLSVPVQRMALAAMALATAFTLLFLASPEQFRAGSREDGLLEWTSALLLFVASGCFAWRCLRALGGGRGGGWERMIEPLAAGALAILLFVIAMEEISWMQRLFGFATPASVEAHNWQGEFNLHNMHTDLSETVYYTGAVLFLTLLPLLRDARRGWGALEPLRRFVPDRAVAAIAAPAAVLNYGHWNLLPIQIVAFAALFVMVAYGIAATRRGDVSEGRLFFILSGAMIATQALLLAYGHRQIEVPNATEYKELFIALGLAAYGLRCGFRGVADRRSLALQPAE